MSWGNYSLMNVKNVEKYTKWKTVNQLVLAIEC